MLMLGWDEMAMAGVTLILSALMAFQAFAVSPARAEQRVGLIAFTFLLEKSLSLVALLVTSHTARLSPVTLLAVLCCGLFFSLVPALRSWENVPWGTWRLWLGNPWLGTRHLGYVSLAARVGSLDVLALSHLSGTAASGQYGAVSRWGAPFSLYAQSVSQIVVPDIVRAPSNRAAFRHLRLMMVLLIPAAGAAVIAAIFANEIVGTLLGKEFSSSSQPLRVVAIGMLATLANVAFYAYAQGRHLDVAVSRSYLTGAAVQAVSLVSLAPSLGATGAAIAFALGQTVIAAMSGAAVRKAVRD
jgi:O-antigen/teichoic acid export membrane protein